jgi:tRNA threonylcarbamoyladenosine biosynthesis protein TsaE
VSHDDVIEDAGAVMLPRAVHLVGVDETARAGRLLAGLLAAGDVVGLVGDLGAGKTALSQAVIAAIGAPVAATSPTFTLINEHRGGRLPVWHVDLYRIERARELEEIGLDEIIDRGEGVVLIEWADRFPVLPADHLRVELTVEGEGRRLLASGGGPRGQAIAAAWRAAL